MIAEGYGLEPAAGGEVEAVPHHGEAGVGVGWSGDGVVDAVSDGATLDLIVHAVDEIVAGGQGTQDAGVGVYPRQVGLVVGSHGVESADSPEEVAPEGGVGRSRGRQEQCGCKSDKSGRKMSHGRIEL